MLYSNQTILNFKYFQLIDSIILTSLKKTDCFIDFLLEFNNILLLPNNLIDNYKDLKEEYLKNKNLISIYDIISRLELFKNTKNIIKEFNTLYKYDTQVLELIKNEIVTGSETEYSSVLNLFLGLGMFKDIVSLNTKFDKMVCYDQDDKLVELGSLTCKNPNISINKTDILHSNDIKDTYDLIVSEVPENIKNIIYAKLCSKIKELKIRGTKSEPLILQLIFQHLKTGGKTVLIIPNSFLFGDSKQHIETRKFIYKNSSNIKIINLSNKKSIFVATKDDRSVCILTIKTISNDQLLNPNNEQIINSNYSFYYSNYELETKTQNQSTCDLTLDQIVEIYSPGELELKLEPVLYSYSNINFDFKPKPDKFEYIFVTKDENTYKQEFLNYLLMYIFEKNIDLIVKGKTNILCIDKIKKLKVKNFSLENQNNIINLLETNRKLENLINIQKKQIDIIIQNEISNLIFPMTKLGSVITIGNTSDSEKTISINKNSSMAGNVFITNEPTKSDNIYFLTPLDNSYIFDFLYIYLKFKQDKIIELAKMNNSISLSRKYLESFEIPIIPIDEQKIIYEKIQKYIKLYDSFIKKSDKEIINLFFSSH